MKYKILISVVVGFLISLSFAHASTGLYFSAVNTNVTKGDVFTVDLKINSDKSINTIDGTIIFNKNILSVNEIKTDNSIFILWAKEPVFDNGKGTITFTGGAPGGFTGNDGQVLEIVFSSKNAGETKIDFLDAFSVYLNDGLGTQINPWVTPLNVSIISAKTESVSMIGKTLQILTNKFEENNHLLTYALILLIGVIIILIVKIKLHKRRVK